MTDFPTDLLDRRAHRPWPVPSGPWVMTQSWHDLLFAHWPVNAPDLQSKLPSGLRLDTYNGQAYLGIVAFHLTNVAPRGVPAVPFVSAFTELNVRTYVTVDGMPGIYFFSLDADSQVAVTVARTVFSLPYYTAAMQVDADGGSVTYRSRRTSGDALAEFSARYHPAGPVFHAARGSLEYFLVERYCLYTVDSASALCRLQIHHPPWPLQAAQADLELNTMAEASGIPLPADAPLLHFAKRQDMLGWPMERLSSEPGPS